VSATGPERPPAIVGPGRSDSERRSEIADRTRVGLREDLDDLRERLSRDLESYERRIRETARRAPGWTSVDPRGVVDLFAIDEERLPEEGFLGPRMVAIGAETAEEFVGKWMAAGETDGTFEDCIEEFERDVSEMIAFLEALAGRARRRGERAHRILEEWMEANLAHLDELRQNDLEALQDLVGEGELETGPDARAEEAQLWEEQRKRADELRSIWDDFHELVDEGVAYTDRGLEEVAELVGRAGEGLRGAYPALRESDVLEDLESVGSTDPEGAGPEETCEEGESPEPGRSAPEGAAPEKTFAEGESGDGMAETVSVEDVPDSGPESSVGTDRTRRPNGAAEANDERERWLRRPPEESGESGDAGGAEAETELLDARPGAGEERPESPEESAGTCRGEVAEQGEISPTEPMLGRAVEREEEARNSEPRVSEMAHSAESNSEVRRREVPAGGGDGARADPRTAASEAREKSGARESDLPQTGRAEPEGFETEGLRIRAEWRRVGLGALLAAFGPPVGFVVAMVGIGLAHLAGLEEAFNPVEVWSWVEPAVGVALAWCFGTPLLLGWRPRWAGWQFDFVHEVDLRDEVTVEVGDDGFSLGRVSFAWAAIDAYRKRRWRSSDGEMRGWLLIVEPKYYGAIQIIASNEAPGRWESSSVPVVDPPGDAWQIDTMPMERFRAHLEFHGIEAPHSSDSSSESLSGSITAAPSGTSK